MRRNLGETEYLPLRSPNPRAESVWTAFPAMWKENPADDWGCPPATEPEVVPRPAYSLSDCPVMREIGSFAFAVEDLFLFFWFEELPEVVVAV